VCSDLNFLAAWWTREHCIAEFPKEVKGVDNISKHQHFGSLYKLSPWLHWLREFLFLSCLYKALINII
jgi:hypothetical protein